MIRLYVRALRLGTFALCALLLALAACYQVPGAVDDVERAYDRVWQFYQLAAGVAMVFPVWMCLRASGNAVYSRFVPARGPRSMPDWWAQQSWGPLLLESLFYAGWFVLMWIFIQRYQLKLPAPEPYHGEHPPWPGVTTEGFLVWVRAFASGLLLAVAGAYSGLCGGGMAPAVAWLVLSLMLPSPLAACLVCGLCWLWARGVQEPPSPVPPIPQRAFYALLVTLGMLLPACYLVGAVLRQLMEWRWLSTSTFAPPWAAALGLALWLEKAAWPRSKLISVVDWVIMVGVLGLLAAILLPNFLRSGHGGQETACKSNLKNIGTALEMYSTDFAGAYPAEPALLTPNYLKTIPTCPAAGWVTYRFQLDPVGYTVVCGGHFHRHGNFPQYTAVDGLKTDP